MPSLNKADSSGKEGVCSHSPQQVLNLEFKGNGVKGIFYLMKGGGHRHGPKNTEHPVLL